MQYFILGERVGRVSATTSCAGEDHFQFYDVCLGRVQGLRAFVSILNLTTAVSLAAADVKLLWVDIRGGSFDQWHAARLRPFQLREFAHVPNYENNFTH
jgi:hypothetical protein